MINGATTRDDGACEGAAIGSSNEKAIVHRSGKKRESRARGRKRHGESERSTLLANGATAANNSTYKDGIPKGYNEKAIVPKTMKKKESSARISDGHGESLPLLSNEDAAADKRASKDAPQRDS